MSWAISWVFTWPDTRLTRPSTCPVSSPQMVQVVSMLEVPARKQQQNKQTHMLDTHNSSCERTTKSDLSGFLTQQIGIDLIPVEGGERGAEVWVLVVVQQTLETRFCVTDLQNTQAEECVTEQTYLVFTLQLSVTILFHLSQVWNTWDDKGEIVLFSKWFTL